MNHREEMMYMKTLSQIQNVVIVGVILFFLQGCVTPTEVPVATVVVATTIPLSQQVMLTFISFNESGQAPMYVISAKTPLFSGSDDPRVKDFNKEVSDIVQKEIKYFRDNVLAQMPIHPVSSGSFFDAQYELIFQQGNIW